MGLEVGWGEDGFDSPVVVGAVHVVGEHGIEFVDGVGVVDTFGEVVLFEGVVLYIEEDDGAVFVADIEPVVGADATKGDGCFFGAIGFFELFVVDGVVYGFGAVVKE